MNTCENCGGKTPKKEMKFCCRKCTDEAKSKRNNEIRICLECGCGFNVQKSNKKRICSEECRKKWAAKPENLSYRINASKTAVKEKFGVDNIFQLEETKEKLKQTKLERYGDENYNNSEKQLKTLLENNGANYFEKLIKNRKEDCLKKHGVNHHLKLQKFRDKQKQTNLHKYGHEHILQVPKFNKKQKETIFEKFGVDNISQNSEIKEKKKETSMNNFGVTHHLKDSNLFRKHFISQYKIKKYKDTDLYYQGSYELFFLEKMEEKGLLNELTNGRTYKYEFEGEEHNYHTDFFFRDKNIEIKSGWTYNENGKNMRLQNLNECKWQTVRDFGDLIEILIDKANIDRFVLNI